MSITSDIRSYADTALEQGKQVLDQAGSQLSGVTAPANELVGKVRVSARENVTELTSRATDAVTDLRAQAEKAVNLDAIKTAIEPYLAQARGYSHSVTDRAEGLLATVKTDKRVSGVLAKAEELSNTVVQTVQERIVKPVQNLTGRGTTSTTTPARKVAATTTAPAAKAAPRKAAPVKKATARA